MTQAHEYVLYNLTVVLDVNNNKEHISYLYRYRRHVHRYTKDVQGLYIP